MGIEGSNPSVSANDLSNKISLYLQLVGDRQESHMTPICTRKDWLLKPCFRQGTPDRRTGTCDSVRHPSLNQSAGDG